MIPPKPKYISLAPRPGFVECTDAECGAVTFGRVKHYHEIHETDQPSVSQATAKQVEDDPNELLDGSYRTLREFCADEGDVLLRKHGDWTPPNDCEGMSVPEMILHIYKNRHGHAVAPNGSTTPFLSVEEWSRIADWVKETHPPATLAGF